MSGSRFELNEATMHVIEEIGGHMPGGFFVYKAEEPEELIYVNQAVLDIYGCKSLEEFKVLTGFTFRGMVHLIFCQKAMITASDRIWAWKCRTNSFPPSRRT